MSHGDDSVFESEIKVPFLPGALNKALNDRPWFYAVRLRDGTEIKFTGAVWSSDSPDWLHLTTSGLDQLIFGVRHIDRGVDVRISEVVMAVDLGE